MSDLETQASRAGLKNCPAECARREGEEMCGADAFRLHRSKNWGERCCARDTVPSGQGDAAWPLRETNGLRQKWQTGCDHAQQLRHWMLGLLAQIGTEEQKGNMGQIAAGDSLGQGYSNPVQSA